MSEHHKSPEWRKLSAMYRKRFEAMLPLPCINGSRACGGIVMPGQAFDVSHIVDVVRGGDDSPSNIAISHKHCNRSAGGTIGNAKRNAVRASQNAIDQKTRPWC